MNRKIVNPNSLIVLVIMLFAICFAPSLTLAAQSNIWEIRSGNIIYYAPFDLEIPFETQNEVWLNVNGSQLEFNFETINIAQGGGNQQSLIFKLPLTAIFHIPRHYGAYIDADMPLGKTYNAGLTTQFFVIEINIEINNELRTVFLLFAPKSNALSLPAVSIFRGDSNFELKYTVAPNNSTTTQLFLKEFPSLEQAVKAYQVWFEANYPATPKKNRTDLPAWLHNTKIVFTIDLWRPNGVIAHDYADVTEMIKELYSLGVPEGTLFYIPGWFGRFESRTPHYWPVDELSGDKQVSGYDAFKTMVDTAHQYGYRIMIHTTPWGIDQYIIENHELAESLGTEVSPGWTGGSSNPSDFYTVWKQVSTLDKPSPKMLVQTPNLPEGAFEKFISISGLSGIKGDLYLKKGHRELLADEECTYDAKEGRELYKFKFTLDFVGGQNSQNNFELGSKSGKEYDWSVAEYKIHEGYTMGSFRTLPLAKASGERWYEYFNKQVVKVVNEFDIDAVHLDAVSDFSATWFQNLTTNKLPVPFDHNVVFSTEDRTEETIPWLALVQDDRISIYTGMGGAMPDQVVGTGEEFEKPSPVYGLFYDRYFYFYNHLVSPKAYVPLGTVVSWDTPSPVDAKKIEYINLMHNIERELGTFITFRVNYHDYGIDSLTKDALKNYVSSDTTPPTKPQVFDEGQYTQSTVQLYAQWSSSDPESGIAEYQYRVTQGSLQGTIIRDWTSTEAYNYVTAGGLSLAGNNTYYFAVKAKNGAGLWSLWSEIGYSDGITVDVTPPTGTIKIKNNAAYTKTTSVTLNLSATDNVGGSGMDKMQFSNDNVNWSAPVAYVTTKSWTLTAGDGTKTVYVKLLDKAGNWSAPISDTIILDTAVPAITNISDLPDPFNPEAGERSKISFTLADNLSTSLSVYIYIYNSVGVQIRTLSGSKPLGNNYLFWNGKDKNGVYVPDGTYKYKIKAQDMAGNYVYSAYYYVTKK